MNDRTEKDRRELKRKLKEELKENHANGRDYMDSMCAMLCYLCGYTGNADLVDIATEVRDEEERENGYKD